MVPSIEQSINMARSSYVVALVAKRRIALPPRDEGPVTDTYAP